MQHFSIRTLAAVILVFGFVATICAQAINITGTVVDSGTQAGINNSLVILTGAAMPCTTHTGSTGSFTMTRASTGTIMAHLSDKPAGSITIRGNMFFISGFSSGSDIGIDIFAINGVRLLHS